MMFRHGMESAWPAIAIAFLLPPTGHGASGSVRIGEFVSSSTYEPAFMDVVRYRDNESTQEVVVCTFGFFREVVHERPNSNPTQVYSCGLPEFGENFIRFQFETSSYQSLDIHANVESDWPRVAPKHFVDSDGSWGFGFGRGN
jgi:hypothetical protein